MSAWILNLWVEANNNGVAGQNLRSIQFANVPKLFFLAEVVKNISKNFDVISKLSSNKKMEAQGWNNKIDIAHQNWIIKDWPNDAWIAKSDWRHGVIHDMSGTSKEKTEGNPMWAKGGWLWDEGMNTWVSPVLTQSTQSERQYELSFQPVALTLWQWDHDWLALEDRCQELNSEDLWGMCQSMRPEALKIMKKGLTGHCAAPAWIHERIDILLEYFKLEEDCIRDESIQASENKRL